MELNWEDLLGSVEHNQYLEEMVDLICKETQNDDKGFFRVEVAYFLSKMASAMRCTVSSPDRGEIPVNAYALCLATSGYSKGRSVNFIEEKILKGFKDKFMENTFEEVSKINLEGFAASKAAAKGTDPAEELAVIEKAFNRAGSYLFTFDSGTAPAIKQLRQKLLMAGAGSINFQVDEIGSNLLGSDEVLKLYLELYDKGKVNQKIIKNTSEQIRDEDIDGLTPANMLLFGTPVRLFDGDQTEDYFFNMLDTGYARRLLFGYGRMNQSEMSYAVKSVDELYNEKTNPKNAVNTLKLRDHFESLADISNYQFKAEMNDTVAKMLLSYEIYCRKNASVFTEFQEINKQEMSHRYFRAMKLAGVFSFVAGTREVSEECLLQAIKLVEESGNNFQQILTRDRPYMKLARYLVAAGREVTHADITEDLPFYGKSSSSRKDIMNLAVAYGYREHIVITRTCNDGVEFFRADALKETDIDSLIISGSYNPANGYANTRIPFANLLKIVKAPVKILADGTRVDFSWCTHHFNNGHRSNADAQPEFNMVVLDVDGGLSINTARSLLQDYTYLIYTTKRHTDQENRFRIVLPLSHVLKLNPADYKAFMNNIISWIPSGSSSQGGVDEASNQISKKWLSNSEAEVFTNTGDLLDPFRFIPHTSRNEEFIRNRQKIANLDKMESWFIDNIADGERNNKLYRYGCALLDSGESLDDVKSRVLELNSKLPDPLKEEEIISTIFYSLQNNKGRT